MSKHERTGRAEVGLHQLKRPKISPVRYLFVLNVEEDSIECESCLNGSTMFVRPFQVQREVAMRFLAVTCQPTSCSSVVSV